MAQEWKIKCDCGTVLKEGETVIDHIRTTALVCSKCGFATLTKDQAKSFQRKLELHNTIDQEKQIIKIGNSMGLTLPEKLRAFGLKIGSKVKLEVIDEHSFKVNLQ